MWLGNSEDVGGAASRQAFHPCGADLDVGRLEVLRGDEFCESLHTAHFGREAALSFVEFDQLLPIERERAVEKKVREILQSMAHVGAK
jgi:hypothetical protein